MSAILIAILAVAAIGLAVRPLFQLEQATAHPVAAIDSNVENLLSAREATYAAIKDLETDHAMGKLSDADFQNLRAKYEGKALAILQQLDAAQVSGRLTHRVAPSSGTCARCGTPIAAGDKFCRSCGVSLAPTCALCGAPVTADARFCRQCGAPVAALQPA